MPPGRISCAGAKAVPFFRVPVNYYVQTDNISAAYYVITNYVYADPKLSMLADHGVIIVDVEGDQTKEVPPDVMEQVINKYPPFP